MRICSATDLGLDPSPPWVRRCSNCSTRASSLWMMFLRPSTVSSVMGAISNYERKKARGPDQGRAVLQRQGRIGGERRGSSKGWSSWGREDFARLEKASRIRAERERAGAPACPRRFRSGETPQTRRWSDTRPSFFWSAERRLYYVLYYTIIAVVVSWFLSLFVYCIYFMTKGLCGIPEDHLLNK